MTQHSVKPFGYAVGTVRSFALTNFVFKRFRFPAGSFNSTVIKGPVDLDYSDCSQRPHVYKNVDR